MPKKQADGRYRAKVTVGRGPDGRPVVKYASGRTKRELAEAVEELRRIYTGGEAARRDISFGEFASEWYYAYKKGVVSVGSQKNYQSILNRHLLPALGERQLRAIRPADLQSLVKEKAPVLSGTSMDKLIMTLKQIFAEATAQSLIDRDPSLRIVKPKTQYATRRPLTEAEARAALHVGHAHEEGLLLLLLYYTGMRIGEVLGLQWQDIDFEARLLQVRRDIDFHTNTIGGLKSASSVRDIPMPDELYHALKPLRGVRKAFVLPAPESGSFIGQSTLKRRWTRLTRAMYAFDDSIESNGERSILTPHYFRHNYASMLYNADIDVLSAQKWLGHADVKTTLAVYSHLSEAKKDFNAGKLNLLFSEKVAEKLPNPNPDH